MPANKLYSHESYAYEDEKRPNNELKAGGIYHDFRMSCGMSRLITFQLGTLFYSSVLVEKGP